MDNIIVVCLVLRWIFEKILLFDLSTLTGQFTSALYRHSVRFNLVFRTLNGNGARPFVDFFGRHKAVSKIIETILL